MLLRRKNLLVTLLFCLCLNAFAQNMTTDETTNNIYLSSKTTPIFKGYKNTRGSIYSNKDFQRGSVFKDGKVVANNVGLRYNVQEEEIELKKNANSSSTVANVIKADQSIHVRILNDAFVYLISPDKNQKAGYFMVMTEGSKLTIYKKITKDFVEGKKSVNSYSRDVPDTFKEKEQLYIVSNTGSLTKLPKSKGKRKKLFSSKEAEMKSFIDLNELSFRKDSDFYKAVDHYNTL
jgi:hypothetical protein